MMRRTVLLFLLMLASPLLRAGGGPAVPSGASEAEDRGEVRVFMPKGDLSAGMQFFYLDLGSSDSEIMLLLQHLDAQGSMLSLSPYFDYTYRDNRSIGVRSKYSSVRGGVSNADFSLLNDGMSMSIENMSATSRTIQSEIFHRSYAPLDKRRRFGVFTDLALSWAHSNTSFSYGTESLPTSSSTTKYRISVHPGLMVFVLNNLSTHVSIGIGGASYTHVDYLRDGAVVGTRHDSKVHFMLDILDISYGLSLHF